MNLEPTTGGFMSTTQARINLSNSSDSTTRNSEPKETFEPQIKPAELIVTESMALVNSSDVIIPETVAPEVLKAATEALISTTTSSVAAVTNATILATTQEKRG